MHRLTLHRLTLHRLTLHRLTLLLLHNSYTPFRGVSICFKIISICFIYIFLTMKINPLIGGSLISGAASLLGGLFSSSSANKAAKTQLQAVRETNALNKELAFQQNEWNLQQWKDRKSTRLNSSHRSLSRMPSSA